MHTVALDSIYISNDLDLNKQRKMGYNTNNKVITICLIFMVCCSGLIECRPTLMKLGPIHMKLKTAAGKRKAVGQLSNDINEQQGNKLC